jgi:hypothetical protein
MALQAVARKVIRPARQPIRIRWWIFAFMFAFAMLSYLQRNSIAVAAVTVMSDLHVTQWQIGLLNAAFTTAYALAQLPGGVIGQRFGAHLTYVAVGIVGLIATFATPLAPAVLTGTALFIALLLAQAVLGISQGPVFPIFAAVLELAELGEGTHEAAPPVTWPRLRAVVGDRNVLLLAFSYLCMNYAFYLLSYWSFLYLVQVRHFSGLESGFVGMAPWIGAATGAVSAPRPAFSIQAAISAASFVSRWWRPCQAWDFGTVPLAPAAFSRSLPRAHGYSSTPIAPRRRLELQINFVGVDKTILFRWRAKSISMRLTQ